jgi:hypothetical protein
MNKLLEESFAATAKELEYYNRKDCIETNERVIWKVTCNGNNKRT